MNSSSDTFVDKTDIGSSHHYLLWFELINGITRSCVNQGEFCIYEELTDYRTITLGRSIRLSLIFMQAMEFFRALKHLCQEGVMGEELVRRMTSKWEKLVDKAASAVVGRKLIICGRSLK